MGNKIAESWEISANNNGMSIVKNGELKNKSLKELFGDPKLKKEIFGIKLLNFSEFPILIKFIDADKNLSIQVHPNDKLAKKIENSQGKSELWYTMDCKKSSKIICGIKNKRFDLEKNLYNSNALLDNLNYINIKKGDSIFIKAGTVHAILEGTLICEIQQNSDITYRIFDWNRLDIEGKPRDLHISKAKKAINLKNKIKLKHSNFNRINSRINSNKYFKTNLLTIKNQYRDRTNGKTFFAYNVIEGNGIIKNSKQEYIISCGDSFIVPANYGDYIISGNIKLLKTFI